LDPDTTFRTRNEALKFILHFIGDIHQPLHAEDLSRGGNDIPVAFDGHRTQRTNLHSVWDSAIARKLNGLNFDAHATEEKPAAAKWAKALAERTKAASLTSPDVSTECSNLTDPNQCGIEWVKDNDLGGEYYEGAVHVVELQIARAGVRLAAWINAIAAVTAEQNSLKDELR
jgi:hypothetical protein